MNADSRLSLWNLSVLMSPGDVDKNTDSWEKPQKLDQFIFK